MQIPTNAGGGSSAEGPEASWEKKTPGSHQQQRKPTRSSLSFLIWTTAFSVQCSCVVLISQYDPSHLREVHYPLGVASWTIECVARFSPPQTVLDPSALVFINSVMLYGLAVLICYNIRKDDPYQDHILAAGIVCGSVVSGATAVHERWMATFKDYTPSTITLSLLFSVAVHEVVRRFMGK